MAETKRNIGKEALDGIREIKSGKHGRGTTLPPSPEVEKLAEEATEEYRAGRTKPLDPERL